MAKWLAFVFFQSLQHNGRQVSGGARVDVHQGAHSVHRKRTRPSVQCDADRAGHQRGQVGESVLIAFANTVSGVEDGHMGNQWNKIQKNSFTRSPRNRPSKVGTYSWLSQHRRRRVDQGLAVLQIHSSQRRRPRPARHRRAMVQWNRATVPIRITMIMWMWN